MCYQTLFSISIPNEHSIKIKIMMNIILKILKKCQGWTCVLRITSLKNVLMHCMILSNHLGVVWWYVLFKWHTLKLSIVVTFKVYTVWFLIFNACKFQDFCHCQWLDHPFPRLAVNHLIFIWPFTHCLTLWKSFMISTDFYRNKTFY